VFRAGQHPNASRYTVIPRTLTFLTRPGEVLLIRVAEHKGAWAGQLNGIGGHIEAGEDPLTAARRELVEEAGLRARRLRLVGTIVIDVGQSPGIALCVFVGESDGIPQASAEGQPLWVPLEQLGRHQLVEDIPEILPLALRCFQDGMTFTGIYRFNPGGQAVRTFTSAA
jgi:8-oxo-dGTP diphosphatase